MRMLHGSARAAAPLLAALAACGPSYTLVADGDSQWDRCYSLDHDEQSSNDDRLACWRAWEQSYSVGQPQERIRQARARISELSHASAGSSGGARAAASAAAGNPPAASGAPQPPPGWGGAPGYPPAGYAPQPPPQPAAPPAAPGPAQPAPGGPQPPGSSCENGCRDAWNTCATGCNGDAACSARCDDTYRDCMRGCF